MMRKLANVSFCSVALIFCCAIFASAADEVKLPAKEKFHLYLLVGQSNMAGRGKVEAEDKNPVANLLMLDKLNNWVPAVDPLHFDKPSAGVGPGRTFGIAVAAAEPTITVGLIPCAAGGSPIDAWKPGAYHAQTKSHPWTTRSSVPSLRKKRG